MVWYVLLTLKNRILSYTATRALKLNPINSQSQMELHTLNMKINQTIFLTVFPSEWIITANYNTLEHIPLLVCNGSSHSPCCTWMISLLMTEPKKKKILKLIICKTNFNTRKIQGLMENPIWSYAFWHSIASSSGTSELI